MVFIFVNRLELNIIMIENFLGGVEMKQLEYVRRELGEFHRISEIEIKYLNDNKTTYSLPHKKSREAIIAQILEQVAWDTVDEVEVKIAKGKKKKIDLVEYREELGQLPVVVTEEPVIPAIIQENEEAAEGQAVIIPFNKRRSAASGRKAKVLVIPKKRGSRANIRSKVSTRNRSQRR